MLRYFAAMEGYLDVRTGSVDGLYHLWTDYPFDTHFCLLICWAEGVIDGIQLNKRNKDGKDHKDLHV